MNKDKKIILVSFIFIFIFFFGGLILSNDIALFLLSNIFLPSDYVPYSHRTPLEIEKILIIDQGILIELTGFWKWRDDVKRIKFKVPGKAIFMKYSVSIEENFINEDDKYASPYYYFNFKEIQNGGGNKKIQLRPEDFSLKFNSLYELTIDYGFGHKIKAKIYIQNKNSDEQGQINFADINPSHFEVSIIEQESD